MTNNDKVIHNKIADFQQKKKKKRKKKKRKKGHGKDVRPERMYMLMEPIERERMLPITNNRQLQITGQFTQFKYHQRGNLNPMGAT